MLFFRAKKYASGLAGVESFSITNLNQGDFLWHRNELAKINSIDNEKFINYFSHPINTETLVNKVASILHIKKQFSCFFVFEGRCVIFVKGNDFILFLISIFKLNTTHDLALMFELPDRIICISDDENGLYIYYAKKNN